MELGSLLGKMSGQPKVAEPVYQKLGANVRGLREQQGMSQGQLAEKLGKGASTVAEIEGGSTRILLSDVEAIAAALNVQPKQLLIGVWF